MLDCDMLTWSLGWRCPYCPLPRPMRSRAALARTSFTFMLRAVPAPEFIASTGNCPSSLPARASSHALFMARPLLASSAPTATLATAAERFIMTKALIRSGCDGLPEAVYWPRALWVNGPQYAPAGTRTLPSESSSVLYPPATRRPEGALHILPARRRFQNCILYITPPARGGQ